MTLLYIIVQLDNVQEVLYKFQQWEPVHKMVLVVLNYKLSLMDHLKLVMFMKE